jgi:threonine/homoserine/homoserine lactone efflux protein
MVAGTALERGFRAGLVLALTPLLTDVPPMLFSTLLLERLGWRALNALGIVGGAVILGVGIRFIRMNWKVREEPVRPRPGKGDQSARFSHVVLSSLTNPSPWVFWLVVASPLLLRAWGRSRGEGILFVTVLFGTNILTATALAWIASHGRRLLHPGVQRRALQGVGATLVLVGVLLLWQATQGNFQALVEQQESLRSVVEDGLPAG